MTYRQGEAVTVLAPGGAKLNATVVSDQGRLVVVEADVSAAQLAQMAFPVPDLRPGRIRVTVNFLRVEKR